MAEKLSKQLSDLSARAKNAEDAVAAAQKEAHDKIMARRDQARAAATSATEKVNQEVKSVGDAAGAKWSTLRAKLAADMATLKEHVVEAKRERKVERMENEAERLESEAECAVDYAIASVEQAKLAVLDAIVGRIEARGAARA
jgi:molecular chaperone GrpE (heat shock protein)